MEERDVPPTKEERTLCGKSKLFDILFRWPLFPERQLKVVEKSFEERRNLAICLDFTDI